MILFKTKYLGLQVGYNIRLDLPAGFIIGIGRSTYGNHYRLIVTLAWEWLPRVVWRSENFDHDLMVRKRLIAYLPGIKASAWTGREYAVERLIWHRKFEVMRCG